MRRGAGAPACNLNVNLHILQSIAILIHHQPIESHGKVGELLLEPPSALSLIVLIRGNGAWFGICRRRFCCCLGGIRVAACVCNCNRLRRSYLGDGRRVAVAASARPEQEQQQDDCNNSSENQVPFQIGNARLPCSSHRFKLMLLSTASQNSQLSAQYDRNSAL